MLIVSQMGGGRSSHPAFCTALHTCVIINITYLDGAVRLALNAYCTDQNVYSYLHFVCKEINFSSFRKVFQLAIFN